MVDAIDVDAEFGAAVGPASPDKPIPAPPVVRVDDPGLGDGGDIYADLLDAPGSHGAGALASMQLTQERARAGTLERQLEELQRKHGTLAAEHGRVMEERSALLRNISVLYNTAKLELKRRVDEIHALRAELASAKGQAGTPAPPHRAEASARGRRDGEAGGPGSRDGEQRRSESAEARQSREGDPRRASPRAVVGRERRDSRERHPGSSAERGSYSRSHRDR